MKKACVSMLVFSMIISLLAFPMTGFAERAETKAKLSLSSSQSKINVQQQVHVNVKAEDSEGLYGAEFYVEFDPSILTYAGVENGAHYSVFLSTAATKPGKLYFSAIRSGNAGGSSTEVATITFAGLKAKSETAIQLYAVKGIKHEASYVEVDGKYYASMEGEPLLGSNTLQLQVAASSSNGGSSNETDTNEENNEGENEGNTTTPPAMTNPSAAPQVKVDEPNNLNMKAISVLLNVNTSSAAITTQYAYHVELQNNQSLITHWPIPNNVDAELVGLYYFNEQTKAWEYVREAARTESGLSVSLEKSGQYALMQYQVKFKDTEQLYSEAKRAIEILAARHIVQGVADKEFAPDRTLTRAEWTAMLVRALGWTDTGSSELTFHDVPANAWYSEALRIAVSHGLISGYGDDTFRGNQEISRAELAVLIARVVGLQEGIAATDSFADSDQVPGFAAEAVQFLKDSGLVKGYQDGTFRPAQWSTRAEAVILLLRVLQL